jgi:hypothetical protein
MKTRCRNGFVIASLLFLLGPSGPASADLALSLDQSSYTLNGIGGTTAVAVFVSQTPSGPQVGVGNELLSAGIELSFATGSAAAVLSTADVTGGPAWDSAAAAVGTSGPDTLVDLTLLSLSGIFDLSSPLLLGTFVFHGQSLGTTSIRVESLGPGPSFITAQGDLLDLIDATGGRITVLESSVPEPSSLVILGIVSLILGAAWIGRRSRKTANLNSTSSARYNKWNEELETVGCAPSSVSIAAHSSRSLASWFDGERLAPCCCWS